MLEEERREKNQGSKRAGQPVRPAERYWSEIHDKNKKYNEKMAHR
jgi:hypothetical protein